MNGLRAPVVAGIAGGVGVTTLAVALRAHDAGRAGVETADILACRGTLDSLRRVAAVLERPGGPPVGPPAVLAVTLDGARLPRGPVRARLELLEAAVSAVVLLPHVPRWRTTADPLPEVAQLLIEPAERLPRPLRAYAAALRELAAAVAASGRLRSGAEPVRGAGTAGPVPGGPVPGHGAGSRKPTPPPGFPRPQASIPAGATARPSARADATTGAAPRVLGAFHPVVGPVVRPVPTVAPAAPGPAVRRSRGVRIVQASRPRVPAERIEQVG